MQELKSPITTTYRVTHDKQVHMETDTVTQTHFLTCRYRHSLTHSIGPSSHCVHMQHPATTQECTVTRSHVCMCTHTHTAVSILQGWPCTHTAANQPSVQPATLRFPNDCVCVHTQRNTHREHQRHQQPESDVGSETQFPLKSICHTAGV